MGKISDYAQALKSKLTDLFVVYQINNSELETKSVTTEQIGDAICGEQVHADLETDNQTIIGGINELAKDENIADEYDGTQTYNKGDVVIYKNTLYICTTNNTTGTWDATKWTATTVQSLIGDLSTLTTTDKDSLVEAVNEVNAGKSNIILVERKTAQITMDNYYKSATISLTKTGYTALGIVGYQTNTVGVVCFRNNIEGTNAIVGLVNRDGTTALGTNVDLYIDVLYLKN